ncbi:uncharacterized protein LOC120277756 [Dioscorea cayenensis subsp. rotundata]|uniref:Uncharacterized protein LOC120277756 n=1 Tax=Dioscorea cayennensis subsp. rotundata TaxID=55577 RepID=A0AB40CQW8_DIOCR|nr:uncharacterized protein LOC120277756 [Dioscorea cayenensis subsp. rotundata]
MHGVAYALINSKPLESSPKQLELWVHANKVCRHTIISTLSNELFDVYCANKEAKEIWDSMIIKYIAKDSGKQKFVIGKYYRWEMTEDKDIKVQINEYHKLLEDLKLENIILQEEFVAGLLIEKLPHSWNDYKQQLKHKHKKLSFADLITHIIIEDTYRKECKAGKGKEITTNANLLQDKLHKPNKRYEKKHDFKPKPNNLTFKKKDNCFADDIIVVVISQVNLVANMKEWVIDSGATRHICANKDAFVSYTQVQEGEETVYLGDSRTASVLGKGKILLKLTSGKTLALSDILHIPNI